LQKIYALPPDVPAPLKLDVPGEGTTWLFSRLFLNKKKITRTIKAMTKTPARVRPTICPVVLLPEGLGVTAGGGVRLLFGGADKWKIGGNVGNIRGGNSGGDGRSCEGGADAAGVCRSALPKVIRKADEGGVAVGVGGERNCGGAT